MRAFTAEPKTEIVPHIWKWSDVRPLILKDNAARLLGHEREMLGLYVSDHPLFGIEHVLSSHADTSIASLMGEDGKPEGANVTIAGLITGLQVKRTKKGDLWAIVTVEDLEGAIDVLFFPSDYQLASTLLNEDAIVTVKGRLSRQKDQPELHGKTLVEVLHDRRLALPPPRFPCLRLRPRPPWCDS